MRLFDSKLNVLGMGWVLILREKPYTRNPNPTLYSLLQPGPKKFKLSKIELIYKAQKFKVPPFVI